jgi:hypothetical protein
LDIGKGAKPESSHGRGIMLGNTGMRRKIIESFTHF